MCDCCTCKLPCTSYGILRLIGTVTSKNCAYRDSNSDCLSRVRRSAGLSIPGRDTDYMSCCVFICVLRSLYSALKSIPLQYLGTTLRGTSINSIAEKRYNIRTEVRGLVEGDKKCTGIVREKNENQVIKEQKYK